MERISPDAGPSYLLDCDLFSDAGEEQATMLSRIPQKPGDYADRSYWQERYRAEEGVSYDWYGCSFDDFWSEARKACLSNKYVQALEIGSGNSEWSRLAANRGWQITSTDIDWGVLRAQDQNGYNGIEKLAVDARRLPFADGCFDVAFEKGTLDAISCGACGQSNVASVALELLRCLRLGGVFFLVTAKEPSGFLSIAHATHLRTRNKDWTGNYSWQAQASVSKGGVWIVALVKKVR
ncbi:hypothetical protein KFL_004050060 [Klebsormidium nitens]|uniref:Methyltransferase type 11 domain-containing protein n=1 Tax=Klebsormidium nitens TaxID=105231 RepID=A0A1Y1IGH5_KLENI|nr:hypothetical protein KFL_004050060 [Klebsormidium nitens]|eukprot:GAQ88161.1 hypothetical protein KFL_004050060 [Klebsormidium nitens]